MQFSFQQTLDTLVISTRSSNYEDTKSKASAASKIYKKASYAILGFKARVRRIQIHELDIRKSNK